MSNFWAQKLGVAAPAQPAPPPPQDNSPWWAPKAVPTPQQQQPVPAAVQQVQQQAPMPGAETHFGDLLQQETYVTTKAQSAKDSEPCPDCGSPNYLRAQGHKNSMKQCFECGYNERFLHSTHGASGIGQKDLPTRVARSQQMNTNTFDPTRIIGRVN